MPTIHLNGRVTEEGELEFEFPSGLPAGEARITIEVVPEEGWSDEELDRALEPTPMTGREIVAAGLLGGWADQQIGDAGEWVKKRRRERLVARSKTR